MINDCQTLTCNRDLRQEKCVESRINRLQSLVQNWSRLPEQVYFVSTLKGKVTWYLCYCREDRVVVMNDQVDDKEFQFNPVF